MSTQAPGPPNGQRPSSKGPPPPRRRPAKVDPLVARKKPKPKSGAVAVFNKEGLTTQPSPAEINPHIAKNAQTKLAEFDAQRRKNGGWTDPSPGPQKGVREFPLIMSKKALIDGKRFHVMRLQRATKARGAAADIDPSNQEDFTRPVSLHRRDPRQPPPGRVVKEDAPTPQPVDEKEAELLAQQKAEREAQRAADQAQIAPTVKNAAPKKTQKKEAIKMWNPRKGADEQSKAEQSVHYEEALPWHLEDADGKNVWVGSYIASLSKANVAFVIDGSSFRMVPLEKYYRFTPKPTFQPYTVEEAENMMSKREMPSRWAKLDAAKKLAAHELQASRNALGWRPTVKQESATYRSSARSEKMDMEDIDMEGDEFQDDDENVGLEVDNDEDAKDVRDRVRREQLGANLFGDANEQEVEKEIAGLLRDEEQRKAEDVKLRKAMIQREGAEFDRYGFASDEDNDFVSSVRTPLTSDPL
jgi:transcription initiation factor TFIIF subunit alpha